MLLYLYWKSSKYFHRIKVLKLCLLLIDLDSAPQPGLSRNNRNSSEWIAAGSSISTSVACINTSADIGSKLNCVDPFARVYSTVCHSVQDPVSVADICSQGQVWTGRCCMREWTLLQPQATLYIYCMSSKYGPRWWLPQVPAQGPGDIYSSTLQK